MNPLLSSREYRLVYGQRRAGNDFLSALALIEAEPKLDRRLFNLALDVCFAQDGEPPEPEADLDQFYYDTRKKEYLVKNSEGIWVSYTESQFKRILKGRGVGTSTRKDQTVSDADSVILETQDRRSLVYSGELAGWPAGVHETDSGRVLITRGPRIPTPIRGEFPHLRRFFETLLGDHPDQLPTFYGWLKQSVDSLRGFSFRPAPALVLAGERGKGKSLTQLLITKILGGRFGRPYGFMSGRTDFNADLIGAEHLAIEDDVPSSKLQDRRAFGSKIKEITANEGQRLHAKNRDALMFPVFWRLSVSVNDEPENLMILPPLDASLKDKLIILRVCTGMLPEETETQEGRKRVMDTLSAEIPALTWFLLNEFEIPETLRSDRYGIGAFQHPAILEALDALAPESKLANLIEAELFDDTDSEAWEGSASELERRLITSSDCSYEARKLLSFNTAVGVYLARLAAKSPERFEKIHTRTGNRWRITPQGVKGVNSNLDLKKRKSREIGGVDGGFFPATPEKPFTPFTGISDAPSKESDSDDDDWLPVDPEHEKVFVP